MCYIPMEHRCVCILIEHQRVIILRNSSVFIFLWSISVIYSNGTAVSYILMKQQCVIFLLSISVLYSNGAAVCYILMEHQCVIF